MTFTRFMNKIGFVGCGDHTGGGKSFLLALLLGGLGTLGAYMTVNELLVGYPSIQDNFNFNVLIFLGAAAVLAFFAVFWRHIPLVILLSLLSAAGIFGMIYESKTGVGKYFPPQITARFLPPEEKLAEIRALQAKRLARVTYDNLKIKGVAVPKGALVTITKIEKPDDVRYPYTLTFHGSVDDVNGRVFKFLRTDRTYKVNAAVSLLASSSPNAEAIREISKGQRVVLTGESSANGGLLEVIHNGDKGWLDRENIFKTVVMATNKRVQQFHFITNLRLAVLAGILALMYIINMIRTTRTYSNYYEEKRKKFSWVENMIQKNGNPSRICAWNDVNDKIIWIVLMYFGIALIGAFFINALFFLIFEYCYSSIPARYEFVLLNFGTVLGQAGAVFVTWKVWDSNIDSSSFTPVCPSCGCPHSWVMVFYQRFIKGIKTVKKTTTRTTTRSGGENAYGGGAIGEMFSGNGSTTSTSTVTNNYYYGTAVKGYKCINCNHTERRKDEETWGEERPSEEPQEFPPVPVWPTGMSKLGKIIFVIVAIIIVLVVLSNMELPFLERLPILGNE